MKLSILLGILLCLPCAGQTITETFGTGANAFSIEFVEIGNPGNDAIMNGRRDSNGVRTPIGSVSYVYNLGKYEICRDQIIKANAAGVLGITLWDMSSFGGNGEGRPAVGMSWYDAAKFVNYLNISQGKQAAYKFDGSGSFQLWDIGLSSGTNQYRHKDAYYFLPSLDEWYKGAYGSLSGTWYDYPNGSDTMPSPASGGTLPDTAVYFYQSGPADVTNAGGLSRFGTMAQGGNVWEWIETASDESNNSVMEERYFRGGGWENPGMYMQSVSRTSLYPTGEGMNELLGGGFRVASVPEPSSLSLLVAGGVVLAAARRRKVD